MTYTYAVEAKPSQVLKLPGFTCNGYIVAGSKFLHIFGGEETFEVTTNKPRNAYLKLKPTNIPIDGFLPRPSYSEGWENKDGLWSYPVRVLHGVDSR